MYHWPPEHIARGVRHPRPAAAAAAAFAAQASSSAALPQELRRFLAAKLSGDQLVLAGDPRYEQARVDFNPRFDARRPAGIAFCGSEEDVAACLQGVQDYGVPFRLRAGRHSLAGCSTLDGGLIIDVRGLAQIRLDAAAAQVTVGSGCSLGELKKALDAQGFLLPLGGPAVGVAGFMLGGGFALPSSRTFGLNSDHVTGARVLLADGRVVQANDTVNRDLFWALRGGTGGNFGVLLEVRYALLRAPKLNDDARQWELDAGDPAKAGDLLRIVQDEVLHGAEAELNLQADLRFKSIPGGVQRDKLVLTVWGGYFGSPDRLATLLAPLDTVPHVHLQSGAEPVVDRVALPVLRQSRLVNELSPQAWVQLVQQFAALAPPHASITMEAWGGRIASYPSEQSAFIHREGTFDIYVTAFWRGAAEEAQMQGYLKLWRDPLAPFETGGVYQNFADADDPEYQAHYWGKALPALVAVKRKYDPKGVFRYEQAVKPLPGDPQTPSWPCDVVAALQEPIQP